MIVIPGLRGDPADNSSRGSSRPEMFEFVPTRRHSRASEPGLGAVPATVLGNGVGPRPSTPALLAAHLATPATVLGNGVGPRPSTPALLAAHLATPATVLGNGVGPRLGGSLFRSLYVAGVDNSWRVGCVRRRAQPSSLPMGTSSAGTAPFVTPPVGR